MTGAIYSYPQHTNGGFFVYNRTAKCIDYVNFNGNVFTNMSKKLSNLPLYSQVFICF